MREPVGRARLVARVAFVVYALALLIATHWPRLHVDGPVPRSDLWVHAAAFAAWGALLHITAWPGPPGSRRAMFITLITTLAYATLDEASQAIPAFGRVFDWSDIAANAAGAVVGSVGAGALCARRSTT